MRLSEINRFFEQQLAVWEDAAMGFEALQHCQTRKVLIGGCQFVIQHNPARAISTLAKVDEKSLSKRPCFLCGENRPSQQVSKRIINGKYELLINPFPIFPGHLTIPLAEHLPQSISGRMADMVEIARLLDGYLVFYNGAHCGASAPDHHHFQAVPAEYLPLIRQTIEGSNHFPFKVNIYKWMGEESSAVKSDSDLNIFAISIEDDVYILEIPRKAHRPSCYFDGSLLVSPASIDLAGVIITPRQQDFESIDADCLGKIFNEVCYE